MRHTEMKRISKYVSYSEATKSNTALKNGIDNTPNSSQVVKNKFGGLKSYALL